MKNTKKSNQKNNQKGVKIVIKEHFSEKGKTLDELKTNIILESIKSNTS